MSTSKDKNPDKNQKSKEENYWAVFEAVIRLDLMKGPMAWKISDIARVSKISRTLIYYYFGKSKENIMQTAIDFLGEEYFGLSESRRALWQEGKILESVLATQALCRKSPYVHIFYMNRRGLESPVGAKLREFESRFHQKLHEFFPQNDEEDVKALGAVLFGLVSAPYLTEDGIKRAINIIQSNLKHSTQLK